MPDSDDVVAVRAVVVQELQKFQSQMNVLTGMHDSAQSFRLRWDL